MFDDLKVPLLLLLSVLVLCLCNLFYIDKQYDKIEDKSDRGYVIFLNGSQVSNRTVHIRSYDLSDITVNDELKEIYISFD